MNSGRFDETMLSSADIRSWSGPYAVSEKNACAAAVFPPFAPPGTRGDITYLASFNPVRHSSELSPALGTRR